VTCPHCSSARIAARKRRTSLGYRTFACHDCRRTCNERTAGSFNHLQSPTDVVTMAVLWRLRYKLSLRDVAEILVQRGFDVIHETIRAWEFRFAPLVAERLRARRRGRRSPSWYLDETYVTVAGCWCYLYRYGNLLDSMLSEHRARNAAGTVVRRLLEVTATGPRSVTTDQHPAYRRAIRWLVGHRAEHRTTQYLNNYTEQSHRAVKQRYYPMLGFGSFESASRFCSAFDELRDYFRIERRGQRHVSLADQRRIFIDRWRSLVAEVAAA
jgi:putative transposase